jgi:hypothetical protein
LRFAKRALLSSGAEPAPAATLVRKLGSFARLPGFVLLWLVPVWAMIGLASLAILLVPMRRLGPWFGRNLGAVAFVPLASSTQRRRAEQIRTAIAVAVKYAPFRSNCYPQAIVAQALCRLYRIPYALHFGAAFDAPPGGERMLKAHAWVVSGPVALCGGNRSFRRFGVTGCFVAPLLAP